jgi:hypothetical protein
MPLWADRAAEALATVNYIATALSDDNATDAMTPFDKSCPDYDKLSDYFTGLTDRALVTSQVRVLEEHDTDDATDLVVQWNLDLSNKGMAGITEDRTGELRVHLVKKKGKWKITSLSPISFFDPQDQGKSK